VDEISLLSPIAGPSLTALVPIRNGIIYLPSFRKQISQILSEQDELLAIDDNSDDGTFEFLIAWALHDQRVTVLRNSGNGLVDALNFGIKKARYEWIARFDIDDEYSIQRLKIQRKAIHESHAVIFSDYEFFGDDQPNLGRVYSAITPTATALSLISGQRTAHPSAVFKKELALSVGGYLNDDFPAEDLSLWLRLLKLGTIESIPDLLLRYRISAHSITGQNRISAKNKTNQLVLSSELLREAYLVSIKNLPDTISLYKNLDDGCFRFSLHVRDLLLASNLYGFRLQLLPRLFFGIKRFGVLRFSKATVNIFKFYRIRTRFRSNP
jgi:glycosyltransferase involved in cell wall biosynthesis